MVRVLGALLVVALVPLALGCHSPAAGGSTKGDAVFAATCASCHGPTGKPPASMVAAMAVRDLTSAEFRVRATPELIRNQVRKGSANKLMPGFAGTLTEAQIDAVTSYVMALAQPQP